MMEDIKNNVEHDNVILRHYCYMCRSFLIDTKNLFPTQSLETSFSCRLCDTRFSSGFEFRVSKLLLKNPEVYECYFCKQNFDSDVLWYKHCKKIHTKTDESNRQLTRSEFNEDFSFQRCTKSPKPKDRKYICNVCGEEFNLLRKLKSHKNVHKVSHICEFCQGIFKSKTFLLQHLNKCKVNPSLKSLKEKTSFKRKYCFGNKPNFDQNLKKFEAEYKEPITDKDLSPEELLNNLRKKTVNKISGFQHCLGNKTDSEQIRKKLQAEFEKPIANDDLSVADPLKILSTKTVNKKSGFKHQYPFGSEPDLVQKQMKLQAESEKPFANKNLSLSEPLNTVNKNFDFKSQYHFKNKPVLTKNLKTYLKKRIPPTSAKKNYNCHICGETFSALVDLQAHTVSKVCNLLYQKYPPDSILMKSVEGKDSPLEEPPKDNRKISNQKLLTKSFQFKHNQIQNLKTYSHVNTVQRHEGYVCGCGKAFFVEEALRAHLVECKAEPSHSITPAIPKKPPKDKFQLNQPKKLSGKKAKKKNELFNNFESKKKPNYGRHKRSTVKTKTRKKNECDNHDQKLYKEVDLQTNSIPTKSPVDLHFRSTVPNKSLPDVKRPMGVRHKKAHYKGFDFKCFKCRYHFKYKYILKQALKLYSQWSSQINSSENLECQFCGQIVLKACFEAHFYSCYIFPQLLLKKQIADKESPKSDEILNEKSIIKFTCHFQSKYHLMQNHKAGSQEFSEEQDLQDIKCNHEQSSHYLQQAFPKKTEHIVIRDMFQLAPPKRNCKKLVNIKPELLCHLDYKINPKFEKHLKEYSSSSMYIKTSKKHKCNICGQNFSKKVDLKVHCQTCKPKPPLKTFPNKPFENMNMPLLDPPKNTCEKMPKKKPCYWQPKTTSNLDLKKHNRLSICVKAIKSYKCSICKKIFCKEIDLKAHSSTCESSLHTIKPAFPKEPIINANHVDSPTNTSEKVQNKKSDIVNYWEGIPNLKFHLNEYRNPGIQKETDLANNNYAGETSKNYKCDICEQIFYKEVDLRNHNITCNHLSNYPFDKKSDPFMEPPKNFYVERF